MNHGFVKVGAATPDIRVADVEYNTENICRDIDSACDEGAKLIVFPELCVTGYTCGDLFTHDVLLKAAREASSCRSCPSSRRMSLQGLRRM